MVIIGIKAWKIPEGYVKEIRRNGVVIWQKPSPYVMLDYVYFDGSGMLELPFNITGADTLRIGFSIGATQGNLCGYYSGSSSGTTQYSVYTSATSSYIRYNGQLNRGWGTAKNKDYDLVMTPSGYSDNYGYSGTFTPSTFTGGNPCLGGLPNSGSAKAKFKCRYFTVDGKIDLRPAMRREDETFGLLDTMTGTFYTGSFIHETAPKSLAIGNPNAEEEAP